MKIPLCCIRNINILSDPFGRYNCTQVETIIFLFIQRYGHAYFLVIAVGILVYEKYSQWIWSVQSTSIYVHSIHEVHIYIEVGYSTWSLHIKKCLLKATRYSHESINTTYLQFIYIYTSWYFSLCSVAFIPCPWNSRLIQSIPHFISRFISLYSTVPPLCVLISATCLF